MSQALAHIVDDDEAIRDALTWLFRTRQVACRGWESAEAFLEAWQPDWRGCIVLDIRMREMRATRPWMCCNAPISMFWSSM